MKYLFSLSFLFCSFVYGQGLSYEWGHDFNTWKRVQSIATDSLGNSYSIGYFTGTVDFDPGSGFYNLSADPNLPDVFVLKLDSSGNFVWAISFPSTGYSFAGGIATDNNYVYLTATNSGTTDFDPGPGTLNFTSNPTYSTFFVMKLDINASLVWVRTVTDILSSSIARSIAVDEQGMVYVHADFGGTADFDPGPGQDILTSNGSNLLLAKYDSNGVYQWAKLFGGNSNIARDICVDTDNNIYVTGGFKGFADFDPSNANANVISEGSYDIYVEKFDSAGNMLWVNTYGDANSDTGAGIFVDSNVLYVAGQYTGTVDFGGGITPHVLNSVSGSPDGFVQKLDTAGTRIWTKSIGGVDSEFALSVSVFDNNNICVVGSGYDTVAFDSMSSLYAGEYESGFVSVISETGNVLWNGVMLSQPSSVSFPYMVPHDVAIDVNGNVLVAGEFRDTIDLNPTVGVELASNEFGGAFIEKLNPCSISYTNDIIVVCGSYTWIDGVTYTSSTSLPTWNLQSTTGCDSIVTLNLTVNTMDSTVFLVDPITIQSNEIGVQYQWLNCDNNMAIIAGETNQSFTATQNGNYAVQVTGNGCVDTSACIAVTNVGILENEFGDQLSVSPNPTNGQISVSFGQEFEKIHLQLIDSKGRVVQNVESKQTNKVEIFIEGATGYYILDISAGEKRAVIKVLKE